MEEHFSGATTLEGSRREVMALVPMRFKVEIEYANNVKKEFVGLYYSETYQVVGLLFPTDNTKHKNEIPEYVTLTKAVEGAEEWEWEFD